MHFPFTKIMPPAPADCLSWAKCPGVWTKSFEGNRLTLDQAKHTMTSWQS
jgi:hypothetical protein